MFWCQNSAQWIREPWALVDHAIWLDAKEARLLRLLFGDATANPTGKISAARKRPKVDSKRVNIKLDHIVQYISKCSSSTHPSKAVQPNGRTDQYLDLS